MKQLNLYQGTLGFVPVDTSQDRAFEEMQTGVASDRLDKVLQVVESAGADGIIWKDIATRLGMHHGQVSSALSVLHRSELIAMRTNRRDRCHPYVATRFVAQIGEDNVTTKPKKTITRLKAEAGEELAELVIKYAEHEITLTQLIIAAKEYKAI
jgi:hypothetical protein